MGVYRLADAARILSVSPSRLRYWEKTALLPARVAEGDTKGFAFRDLALARGVVSLLDRGIPLRRIRRSVEALQQELPDLKDRLAALRLWCEKSGRVVLRHGDALQEPEGQLLLDFASAEAAPVPSVTPLPTREGVSAPRTAVEWFERGCELDAEPSSYGDAIAAYDRALALDPELASAHCNLGAVRYNRGQRKAAKEAFLRCLELAPAHLEAHFNLGNLLEEAGDEAAALEHYLAAADTEPAHPEVQVNLALLYEKLGEIDDATRSWRRYLQADPDGAWAQVARQRLVPHEV
ncbi:MAG: tetratricopeptide repeat protein [Myxococcota bacterium]